MISCYSLCLCAIQQSPSIYNNNASNIPNTNINTTRTHILDYSRPSNLQYQAYVPVILLFYFVDFLIFLVYINLYLYTLIQSQLLRESTVTFLPHSTTIDFIKVMV